MLAERVKEWSRRWQEGGRQEGRAELLTRQLERKFGVLEASVRDRIDRADAEQLLEWAERVLTAPSVEDVFC